MQSPEAVGTEPRHPVRLVSERTGLSPHVLRVWERRYQVVAPERSAGGQRLYSDADIERLRLLRLAAGAGRNISQIAALPNEELRELIAGDEAASPPAAAGVGHEEQRLLAGALEALERLDGLGLDRTLRLGMTSLGIHRALDEVVSPLLVEIGERWHAATLNPAEEHMATAVVQRLLAGVMSECALGSAGRPHVLVATPTGQRHELGAMLVGASAAALGWRVSYLGMDLPIPDIVRSAATLRVEAVALSLVYPADDPVLATSLTELERDLPTSCLLLLGGAAAPAYARALDPRRVATLPDLATLRQRLLEFRDKGPQLR